MNLLVLSKAPSVPSNRHLAKAAEAKGHQLTVLNPSTVPLLVGAPPSSVKFDVVIPRLKPDAAEQALLVARAFEATAPATLNSVTSLLSLRFRARWLMAVAAAGLEVPRAAVVRSAAGLPAVLKSIGGAPVQALALASETRVDAVICESERTLEPVVEALIGVGHAVLLQEHVRLSARVLRATVVGGAVVHVSHVSKTLGTRLEALEKAASQVAVLAAKACGLAVCAVDVSLKRDALLVTAVTASPALNSTAAAAVIALAEQAVAGSTSRP